MLGVVRPVSSSIAVARCLLLRWLLPYANPLPPPPSVTSYEDLSWPPLSSVPFLCRYANSSSPSFLRSTVSSNSNSFPCGDLPLPPPTLPRTHLLPLVASHEDPSWPQPLATSPRMMPLCRRKRRWPPPSPPPPRAWLSQLCRVVAGPDCDKPGTVCTWPGQPAVMRSRPKHDTMHRAGPTRLIYVSGHVVCEPDQQYHASGWFDRYALFGHV